MSQTTHAIADVVLTELSRLRPQGTTHRQLQQFLYMLNADVQLIAEPFQYYRCGPTLPSINRRFGHLRSAPIDRFDGTLRPDTELRQRIAELNRLSDIERIHAVRSISKHHLESRSGTDPFEYVKVIKSE